MRRYNKIMLPLLASLSLGADINGGDLKLHDLQSKSNDIQVPSSTPSGSVCGAPPAGYFIWFDGEDPYAGGATPADPITWIDKGRESRTFDNNTAGHRPTLNAGYFTFDGTNDYLKAAPDSNWSELFGSSDYFCNQLVRNNLHSSLRQAVFSTYSTGTVGRPNFNFITDLYGGQQELYINNGTGTHMKRETAYSESLNTWYNFKVEYDRGNTRGRTGNDASWSSYTSTLTAVAAAPISSYYTYTIGAISAGVTYASDTSSNWNWSGDIAQIICYTDLTKETEVETWIDCKKGEL